MSMTDEECQEYADELMRRIKARGPDTSCNDDTLTAEIERVIKAGQKKKKKKKKKRSVGQLGDRDLYYLEHFIHSLLVITRAYSCQSEVTDTLIDDLQNRLSDVVGEQVDRNDLREIAEDESYNDTER